MLAATEERPSAEGKSLVRHTGELVKHKHTQELRQVTGENFNVFHILGVWHYEVSTHSPIFASLLYSKGTHGQGTRFLACFIDTLKLEGSFDANSSSVRVGYSIGLLTHSTEKLKPGILSQT